MKNNFALIAKGNLRKSRARTEVLVTSFVDVLLFSFQGSSCFHLFATLIGDSINIPCFNLDVNTISKYFSELS
ncbi:hypothetical protein [Planococcus versutus]|uniref:hypothetical protein n=1 Tax=Planococcus versutus TaxID=1302659 RepID=UPI00194E9B0F|nr:hypothetical protein [Planococcus versutus]